MGGTRQTQVNPASAKPAPSAHDAAAAPSPRHQQGQLPLLFLLVRQHKDLKVTWWNSQVQGQCWRPSLETREVPLWSCPLPQNQGL